MTFGLRIRPEAESELAAAAQRYESKRAGLGAEFLAAIDEALERTQDSPSSFPIWQPGQPFRRHLVPRFPFVIFFTVSAENVDVVAFAHAKRRPGYRQGR